MSKVILKNGVTRKTRGFECVEMPYPVTVCITNPVDRYVTVKERKWSKILPFAESLWLALGLNNLDSLPGNYVKNLYNFSDNGHTWRAGYGPRIRAFSGLSGDYNISDPEYRGVYAGYSGITDQLEFVIKSLLRDKNTRQALITIHDPAKDDFDNSKLKKTKDQPCTRSIHFQVNTRGELDVIAHLRSNDLLWGFSAVNVFNFTFMQEYVANILGLPIGNYYHIADNFHYYKDFEDRIKEFAELNIEDFPTGEKKSYADMGSTFKSLEHFDESILKLYDYERSLRSGNLVPPSFKNKMIQDWARVFYLENLSRKIKSDPNHPMVEIGPMFSNDYLNNLFEL